MVMQKWSNTAKHEVVASWYIQGGWSCTQVGNYTQKQCVKQPPPWEQYCKHAPDPILQVKLDECNMELCIGIMADSWIDLCHGASNTR